MLITEGKVLQKRKKSQFSHGIEESEAATANLGTSSPFHDFPLVTTVSSQGFWLFVFSIFTVLKVLLVPLMLKKVRNPIICWVIPVFVLRG